MCPSKNMDAVVFAPKSHPDNCKRLSFKSKRAEDFRLAALSYYLTISEPPYIAEVLSVWQMFVLGVHTECQLETSGIGYTYTGAECI